MPKAAGAHTNPVTRAVLRSPGLEDLLDDEAGFRTAHGERFPVADGIVWLLAPEERGVDVGDGGFYDRHPFGRQASGEAGSIVDGVETELQELLQQYRRDALVLDVGAGAGRVLRYLAAEGFINSVGLDRSLASLLAGGIGPQVLLIWGDALQLPLASGAFDLVISTGVAHHTADPHRAIDECVRVLAPGGRLYLRVYNRASLYFLFYKTYGAVLRGLGSRPHTRRFGDRFGFTPYRWMRRTVFRRTELPEPLLRARYENLLLKHQVHFFTQREIMGLLRKHGLHVESAVNQRTTHRMHCYVCRKSD